MFGLRRTYSDPQGTQSGFAAIGEGAQTTGQYRPAPTHVAREPVRPVQGIRSWLRPSSAQGAQRGFPSPENRTQRRPPGSMPNVPPMFGGVGYHRGPIYDLYGADNFVPITGKVLTNPIGAGVVALFRPQASYGPAAQFFANQIFWTSQAIPTSTKLQSLQSMDTINAILSQLQVYGEYATTG